MLTCTVHKVKDLSPRDLACWRAMMTATDSFASPILSPEFAQAVARVRNDVHVAVYRRGAEIVGFLAHHRRPGAFARPAGAPFADYSALLTFPNPQMHISDALRLAGIDRLQVAGLVDPYMVFGNRVHNTAVADDAYAMDLSADDPVNNVPKKHTKNINRLRRHMAEELGEPRFIIDDTSRAHFDAMLKLKRTQVRETGLHDFLSAGWVRRLMINLRDAPRDQLHGCLVTLMAGDTPLMYQFGPRLHDRAHPWVSSYDPAYGALSPGQIFLNDCRMPLKDAGITWYDLSTGQQHYKPAFCNSHSIVHNATVFAASPQGHLKRSFLHAAKAVQGVLGPLDGLLTRVDRRMDVIASLELDAMTRLRGFGYALSKAPQRLKGAEHA